MPRTLARTVVIVAALAVPVLPSAGQSAPPPNATPAPPMRVRWPPANAIVYPDTADGVQVWFVTNHLAAFDGESIHQELHDGFDPQSVNSWVVLTRQLLRLSQPPVEGDSAPYLSSGVLQGRRGSMFLAAPFREGRGLRDGVRLLVAPKGAKAMPYDLSTGELDSLVTLLAVAVPHARLAPSAPVEAVDETSAYLLSGHRPAGPRYPDQLKRARVQGEVWIEFRVDSLGQVDEGSFRTLLSDHPAFEHEVRKFLRSVQFTPASRAGRPVSQLMMQRFTFALER